MAEDYRRHPRFRRHLPFHRLLVDSSPICAFSGVIFEEGLFCAKMKGVIYFSDVSKVYNGDLVVLDNINLTINTGEFVSIVGHSGAGKTTLMKLILADERPTSGNVFFESNNIHSLKNVALTNLRRRIGVVFQDYRLLSNRTAYENIAFAMEAVGKTDEEISSDV